MLSLAFGGLLWPLAWLWAYTKPVLYRMAYGTDKVPHDEGESHPPDKGKGETEELERLRKRVVELESKMAAKPAEGGKA